jgi:hypothetical protein
MGKKNYSIFDNYLIKKYKINKKKVIPNRVEKWGKIWRFGR